MAAFGRRMLGLTALCVVFPAAWPAAGAVDETEPNDSVATANPITSGATITASLRFPGDQDYFSIELQAGQTIELILDWPRNTELLWTVQLYDVDGQTSLALNEPRTSGYAPLGRIWHTVTRAGIYYALVTSREGTGAGDYAYQLHARVFQTVRESEPNNTPATATAAAMGDTLSGWINGDDIDFYAVDLAAGTNLKLDMATGSVSCHLWPVIKVWRPDGATVVDSSDAQPSNFHLRVPIQTGGRYFVSVRRVRENGPPAPPCYFLSIGTFTQPPAGPGEPTRVLAAGLTHYGWVTGNRSGDVFIASGLCDTERPSDDIGASPIRRLEPNGSLTAFVSDLVVIGPPVFDAFGDLLVPALLDRQKGEGRGVIWRLSPDGARTIFVRGLTSPCAIGLGADGDVWIGEAGTGGSSRLIRFDPVGNQKDTTRLPGEVTGDLAFAPNGTLYFVSYRYLHKRTHAGVERVGDPFENGSAFAVDRDGYVYVTQEGDYGYQLKSKLVLLDPADRRVTDPFAYVNYPTDLTFVGSGSGSRLLAVRIDDGGGRGEVIEFNPDGFRAPGPPPPAQLHHVTLAAGSPARMGAPYADSLRIDGATGAATWSLIAGALPPGVSLVEATGVLAGVPTDSGSFDFSVRGASGSRTGFGRFVLQVAGVGASDVTSDDVADAVLGDSAAVSDSVAASMDQQGNNNGILDVGDLRAYLRATGQLPNGSRAIPRVSRRTR